MGQKDKGAERSLKGRPHKIRVLRVGKVEDKFIQI